MADPLELNPDGAFLVPISGLLDAFSDAVRLGREAELRALLEQIDEKVKVPDPIALQALALLEKIPNTPDIMAGRPGLFRGRCSNYGCARA